MTRTQTAILVWIALGAALPLFPGSADALGIAGGPWFWWLLAALAAQHGRRWWPQRRRVAPRLRRRRREQAHRRIAANVA